MKLKNGKIGNINKKLLAGALALVFTTTSFVGCKLNTNKNNVTYITNESGNIVGFEGTIDFYELANYSFFEVKNNIKNEKYYTIACLKKDKQGKIVSINDIFTNEDLNSSVFETKMHSNVAEYLLAYNMVKDEYTEEELREVLNFFIESREKDNTKQKVKE